MRSKSTPNPPNPSGLCQCGCGQITARARQNDPRRGWVAREHIRFISGHNGRRYLTSYVVDEQTGCWIFQGRLNSDGYGAMSVRGRSVSAHIFYYEQHRGPIPDGLELDHLCRTRRCCNPDHLEPVTHTENIRRGGVARLSPEKVVTAWELYGVMPFIDIAAHLNVSHGAIKDLFKGKTWRDVSGDNLKRSIKPVKKRLVPDEVAEVRRMLASGTPVMDIARQFGISHAAISAIRSGKTWKNID